MNKFPGHNFYKHGLCGHPLHNIWRGMKKRCYQINSKTYKDYGARGISICKEWLDDFVVFYNWSLENGYKQGLSIERNNHNGNYEPNNCRWIPRLKQNSNTRSSHFITFNNKTMTLLEWSRETNIGHATIINRLKSGWPIEKVLTEKPQVGRNQFSDTVKT